jgi:DNA (cytosine-5)-methyltransferase 1
MGGSFGIVDLFAGPGGLGEGFSQAGSLGQSRMHIELSVEMDAHAVKTLRQRAFLRQFEEFPREYYDVLMNGSAFPDWSSIYPREWGAASNEVKQRTLGEDGVFEELSGDLDRVREEFSGDTLLIGGPPCQAYSLAGRVRNKGKSGYVAENDERHYLYREYVRILDRLRPAAFVMENVKGMLSSKVDGGGIFQRVLEDLRSAGDGYELIPLSSTNAHWSQSTKGQDFLVKSEDYGVPQARHRVIILGVRIDVARTKDLHKPMLETVNPRVDVSEALTDLAPLRSGLSKNDSFENWVAEVRRHAGLISEADDIPPKVKSIVKKIAKSKKLPHVRSSGWKGSQDAMPEHLKNWFQDERLVRNIQHETRGHISADLGRYLYSSAFTQAFGISPKLPDFPDFLLPAHKNRTSGNFVDRFRTQAANKPSSTVTSHISKDGHYFIHPDPLQCRALTVREAARLQTFPDNYWFSGPRTQQYHQVGNAVPPYLAYQIGMAVKNLLS